jgi:uncharacterized protein YdaU (DUF1376 family)
MKDYPYFPCYIAEVLLDTAGMSDAEIGQYFIGLIRSWKRMDAPSMPDWLAECAEASIAKSRRLSDNAKARWEQSKSTAKGVQLHNKSNASSMQLQCRGEEKRGEDKKGEEKEITTGQKPLEILADYLQLFNRLFPEYSYTPRVSATKSALAKKLIARLKSFEDLKQIIEEESKYPLEGFVLDGNWFGFPWLVNSDSNLEKFAAGNYRAKDSRSESLENTTNAVQGAISALTKG